MFRILLTTHFVINKRHVDIGRGNKILLLLTDSLAFSLK